MRTTIVNSENLLKFLKENTKQSWYWIGYLLAIKKQQNIFYTNKEKKLQELSSLIGKKINNRFSFSNQNIVEFISSIFNSSNLLISNEKLISMLIGIIDGKCSITFYHKKNTISVFLEINKEYEKIIIKTLNKIFELCDENYKNKITYKKENIRLYITNPIVINLLSKKAIEYSLPITDKWDKIKKYSSIKYELQRKRELLLPALLEQGYSLKDLAQTLEMSESNVCRLLRRLKK